MPSCFECGESQTRLNISGVPLCEDCYFRTHSFCNRCNAELPIENTIFCEDCSEEIEFRCNTCNQRIESSVFGLRDIDAYFCQTCFDSRQTRCCVNCHNHFFSVNTESQFCSQCLSQAIWNHLGFFTENPSYTDIKSERKFGVEFETSACPGHHTLYGKTSFGCKEDGSVDGFEFVSPVLYGDEGLNEVTNFCDLANELEFKIDSACGFHIHLDLSSESHVNCFKVAYAYMYSYPFWSRFVSNTRKNNYYCTKHFYTSVNLIRYDDFIDWIHDTIGSERYHWVNWGAYLQHKTVELRNHAATLNAIKVCNWIKAHARFIDKIISLPLEEIMQYLSGQTVYEQFNVISSWWDDEELSNFYQERASHFGKPVKNSMLIEA